MSIIQQFKIPSLASNKNYMVYKGVRNTNHNENKNHYEQQLTPELHGQQD